MSIPGLSGALNTGLDSIIKTFKGLGSVGLEIGIFGAVIAAAGLLMTGTGGTGYLAILAGLGAIALLIGGLEGVIAAIGALDKIPGFKDLVSGGLDNLANLFSGLGKAIGGFVGGISQGITEGITAGIANSLGMLGTGLSEFMTNGKGFFENLDGIDEKTVSSVEALAKSVLYLTAASFIKGVQDFFSILTGKNNLVTFGQELEEFGKYFVKYANEITKIDNLDTVNSTTAAANSLAEFADKTPVYGGAKQVLLGQHLLSLFGLELAAFGPLFAIYANSVANVDTETVNETSAAAESVAIFANKTYTYSLLGALITGQKILSLFGVELASFGPNFASYASSIANVNSDIVTKSASAASAVADFANLTPDYSVWNMLIGGQKSLSAFGSEMKTFGGYFKDYYDKVKNVTWSTINSSVTAFGNLVTISKDITDGKNGDGSKLTSFASSFKTAAGDYKAGLEKLTAAKAGTTATTSSLGYSFGQQIGKNIKAGIQSVTDTISFSLNPTSGKTYTPPGITTRASGGYVNSGDLFYANENGRAEFMTHVGNQTAVYNQDQMVAALTNAIVSGFNTMSSNSGGGTTNIYIDGKKIYSGQNEYQNREADRYGTATIRI